MQLKQDAEFPRFSHRLLELIYPNFLAPVPAMLVAQVTPVTDANLLKGPILPRDTPLTGPASAVSKNRCEFRTGQALQLSPLSTLSADYFLNMSELGLSRQRQGAWPCRSARAPACASSCSCRPA